MTFDRCQEGLWSPSAYGQFESGIRCYRRRARKRPEAANDRKRRSRRLFDTTNTLENAVAAPYIEFLVDVGPVDFDGSHGYVEPGANLGVKMGQCQEVTNANQARRGGASSLCCPSLPYSLLLPACGLIKTRQAAELGPTSQRQLWPDGSPVA